MDRVTVRNARLVGAGGREVALWGTNYYIAHGETYQRCAERGLDHKQEAARDFAHLRRMGVELIRLHLFEDDFTTPEGDLIANDHLEMLDYTLGLCAEHGMRFFLCPIAWWQGTRMLNARGGFRNLYSNPALIFHERAIAAQTRYVRQLLAHRNPHRAGLTYAEDPLIAAVEIRNEPEYVDLWKLNLARGGFPPSDVKPQMRIHQEEGDYLYARWVRWCEARGTRPDAANYRAFTRDVIAGYVSALSGAIRGSGYPGPVFYAYFGEWHIPDLAGLLATVPDYDGVTFNCYAKVTSESPALFVHNPILNVAEMDMSPLRQALKDKPKAVYECDSCCTSGVMFPAMALKMREAGAQMAAQWCYAPLFKAADGAISENGHYLNLVYTPADAVAFRIGREVFREQPLYAGLGELADDFLPGNNPYLWPKQRPPRLFLQDVIEVGHLTLLPRANTAVWRQDAIFFHSNTTTLALADARLPEHIVASGSSPYVRVMDDAFYEIRVDRQHGTGRLFAALAIVPIRDPRTTDAALKRRPAALVSATPREFDLQGLRLRNLQVVPCGGGAACAPIRPGEFRLPAGEYDLSFEPLGHAQAEGGR